MALILLLGWLPAASKSLAQDHGAAPPPAADGISEASNVLGAKVYGEVCSACHDTGASRAPPAYILNQMTPGAIHKALTSGIMTLQGSGLSEAQKVAVAEFITQRKLDASGDLVPPLMCKGTAARFDRSEPPVFTTWGLDAAGSHAAPQAVAGVNRANVSRLTLKWAFAFPGGTRARSQPALAGGALYVGSSDGRVYALDRQTGCARWVFQAAAEVRTGIVVSGWKAGDRAARPLAYFGDLMGNAYAVDAFTGALVWRRRMDVHPSTTLTAAPTLYQGRLYVPVSSLEEGAALLANYPCCTFRGSVVALNPATGAEIWRRYLTPPPKSRGRNSAGAEQWGPSGAAVWNSPAIDVKRRQLLVTTGDNYSSAASGMSDAIVAIDLATGKINWARQALANDVFNMACARQLENNCPDEKGPDFDFGAGAVVAVGKDGRDYVVAGQKSGFAYGLDPKTGRLIWSRRVGRGGMLGGIHFGIAATGGVVFIPMNDQPDTKTYDEPARPGIYALDVATGRPVWSAPSKDICGSKPSCHPGYSAAISVSPELVFSGSNDAHLRIYDAADGHVVWDVDTDREFATVSGAKGHGGSMSGGAAPMVYRGMLFTNSGYGLYGKMPGNVLLAYGVR